MLHTQSAQNINGLDAWRLFSAVRLHFDGGGYDAIRYNFSMPNLNSSSFQKRADRYIFERHARKYATKAEFIWFSVANVMAANRWIGDTTPDALVELQGRHDSLGYRVTAEMKQLSNLVPSLEVLLSPQGDKPAPICRLKATGDISLETITIMEALTGFLNRNLKSISDPLRIWKSEFSTIQRYWPFLRPIVDLNKYKGIVTSTFTA